ncbi:unnamed protein product [Leuciscus chuanchicus]
MLGSVVQLWGSSLQACRLSLSAARSKQEAVTQAQHSAEKTHNSGPLSPLLPSPHQHSALTLSFLTPPSNSTNSQAHINQKREVGNGGNQAPFSSKYGAEGWTHPRDTLFHED